MRRFAGYVGVERPLLVPTDSIAMLRIAWGLMQEKDPDNEPVVLYDTMDNSEDVVILQSSSSSSTAWEMFGDNFCWWRVGDAPRLLHELKRHGMKFFGEGMDSQSSDRRFQHITHCVNGNVIDVRRGFDESNPAHRTTFDSWLNNKSAAHRKRIRQHLRELNDVTVIPVTNLQLHGNTHWFSTLLHQQTERLRPTWLEQSEYFEEKMRIRWPAFMHAMATTAELSPRVMVATSKDVTLAASITVQCGNRRFFVIAMTAWDDPNSDGYGARLLTREVYDAFMDPTVDELVLMDGDSHYKSLYEPMENRDVYKLCVLPELPLTLAALPDPPFVCGDKVWTAYSEDLEQCLNQ